MGVADVWKSYGDTIRKHGIQMIPLFVFNGPLTNGGPFRDGSGSATIIQGSANPGEFLQALEEVLVRSRVKSRPALHSGEVVPAPAVSDLARGRPMAASSIKSPERAAANAVDGRVDTR